MNRIESNTTELPIQKLPPCSVGMGSENLAAVKKIADRLYILVLIWTGYRNALVRQKSFSRKTRACAIFRMCIQDISEVFLFCLDYFFH
jgi:hypothetical protein